MKNYLHLIDYCSKPLVASLFVDQNVLFGAKQKSGSDFNVLHAYSEVVH